MTRPRHLPDADRLGELRRAGWTDDAIAEAYGVPRQGVPPALRRVEPTDGQRPGFEEEVPWRVKPEHATAYIAGMLRAAARRRRGGTLTATKDRYLINWVSRLNEAGVVVGYDPESEEGWYYTPVRPGVDTWLIREPEWVLARRSEAAE